MTIEQLRTTHRAAPFQPFTIHMGGWEAVSYTVSRLPLNVPCGADRGCLPSGWLGQHRRPAPDDGIGAVSAITRPSLEPSDLACRPCAVPVGFKRRDSVMSTTSPTVLGRATLADLAREPGKAELIGGRIVHLMPTGLRPNLVAGRIYRSLADHVDATGHGVALTDNMGFAVPELPSGRESFSPDVAYYGGPFSVGDMRFIRGAPRSVARATTGRRPSRRWRPSGPSTSPRARPWFGTWTRSLDAYTSIALRLPIDPRLSSWANRLMPSRPCRAGGSRWTEFFPDLPCHEFGPSRTSVESRSKRLATSRPIGA